jgi:hypothetical protein
MVPSLDVILRALGCGIAVPAVIVVVGLLGLRFRGGAVFAVALGLFGGFAALAASQQLGWGFLAYPPADSWDWLPGLALLGVIAGGLCDVLGSSAAARRVVSLGVAALTGWLLVRAEFGAESPSPWWYAGLAAAVAALWWLLDYAGERRPGFGLPALLALVAFGTAALCELSGNLRFAHLSGVLAAVLAGCAVVGWLRPGQPIARATVPAFAVMLPGLLFLSYRNNFGDVPTASYLLLLAAPLLLGGTALFPSPGPARRWQGLIPVGAALLPLGAGLALAALSGG